MIDLDQALFRDQGDAPYLPPSLWRRFTKGIARYGLLQELSIFHYHFSELYSELTSRISTNYLSKGNNIFTAVADAQMNTVLNNQQELAHHIYQAPEQETALRVDENNFEIKTSLFRFLDKQNNPEYLIALQPLPDVNEELLPDYYLVNRLMAYDEEWYSHLDLEDIIRLKTPVPEYPSLFLVKNQIHDFDVCYSSELVNTAYEYAYAADRFSTEASKIESATGKRKLTIPPPLDSTETLLVSDILLSDEFQDDSEARVPIVPSLSRQFGKDIDITVYFEMYNIPPEGYAFDYYFEEKRKILPDKKISDPYITVSREDVAPSDIQHFMITSELLRPGEYTLVFNFRALGDSQVEKTKKVNINILEKGE